MLRLLLKYTFPKQTFKSNHDGFTLLEMVVITIVIGVLAAIAAPSWFSFLQRQRLNTAQGEIYRAIQQAQTRARRDKTIWEARFREEAVEGESVVQWSIRPEGKDRGWNSLDDRISIDNERTDLEEVDGVWRIGFDSKGRPLDEDHLAQVTLLIENLEDRRCIEMATILGAIRQDRDNGCGPKK